MKRILLLLICFTVLSFSYKNIEEYNFIGKWKGTDKGKTGYIIFEKDGTASIKIGDNILGGKDYYINGKKATITYSIDTTTKPINIDFIMHSEGYEETEKLSFIAEIIDDNSFKIETVKENSPRNFSENNSMLLARVQK
ncbi:hypothetical protein E0I26_09095 [Flavobacterium rhamnosiphilum]|uniref:DUF4488 domain-containing protein n=1 Tax=Flavobacterium rhamnosiphilum TaxID=2541724 RepID=A0A4R5F9D5_9FLAO|nr:hypothetical protein [Flavobacterium rhamnosiphilum]TDE44509.1 hypothetical protein E0I26_09095 [Flavobacterium rhamnosiphilum]